VIPKFANFKLWKFRYNFRATVRNVVSSAHKVEEYHSSDMSQGVDDLDEIIAKSELGNPNLSNGLYSRKKVQKSAKELKKIKDSTLQEWYGMKKRKITPEVKQDLLLIKHRDQLNTENGKNKWAKINKKEFPQYFEMGTMIEGAVDFHSAKGNKKAGRVVDEYLAEDGVKQQIKAYMKLKDTAKSAQPKQKKRKRSMNASSKGRKAF